MIMDLIDGCKISTGNAGDPRFAQYRGWFIGGFQESNSGLRHSEDIEIKWCRHAKGDSRTRVSTLEMATSVAILISGTFLFTFPNENHTEITLSTQGDYVIYAPGVAHTWRALEESVVMTIRWPGGSAYRESI